MELHWLYPIISAYPYMINTYHNITDMNVHTTILQTKSFAPSIWEMADVKRGLLCLLFGGTIRKGEHLFSYLLRLVFFIACSDSSNILSTFRN